ncbi:MAG TPA: TonB-dependent siderophore receptor [Thermoanaerobaculia bacterium]|nr:TonB-dependent siderophore receptor [Thermoanaerobaculia bacterium]
MRRLLNAFLCAALLTGAAPLFAATGHTVHGTVVDASGSAVAGARVLLRPEAGAERIAISDKQGRFGFDHVPAVAAVTVIKERFDPITIDLSETQSEVRIVLRTVKVADQITVFAPSALPVRSSTATRTDTPLRDVPQSVTVISRETIAEQKMQSMADVVRYVPGIGVAQGEGNRDTPVFRGNSSTSDFFVDGIRDDVQYFRDLYNVERVEALKGPNAMIFGRGGVGGVLNRVTRQADWKPSHELTLQGGSFGDRRVSGDLGQLVADNFAARVTGMYEKSDSYRDGAGLSRYGVNPTVAFALGSKTMLRAGYEHFHDERTADRGISSFAGRPVATDPSTFFGDADLSNTHATVDALSASVDHRFSDRLTLRSRIGYADYDKFYQNVFPGSVDASGTNVSISAYNNAMQRRNLFSQTDLVSTLRTGRFGHTLLAGFELGRQVTDNFRNTGFFTSLGSSVTTVSVPLSDPRTALPVTFRQNATDADNHGIAKVAAIYAQDQIVLSSHWQVIAGLRYDRFQVDFRNNRTAADFDSRDGLVSPRLGLIYKPAEPVSLYASYSLSYLPRAGEQLSSLSLTNQALKPEEFRNYEVGMKWDVAQQLELAAAVYRLDRGNVAVPDPVSPALSTLVDGQRTEGVELSAGGNLTNAWSIVGAYAYQDGEITRSISATAQAGARLAQVPLHSASLWNKYDLSSAWGVGLGLIHRGAVFTSTDNTVTLPSFTRVDAALFYQLSDHLRAQLNVENLLDTRYFASANSNTNITPGSPRALRFSWTTRF